MYKNFYKLTENPFNLTPDPRFFYLSPVHRRAIAYLNYSLEAKKGFSVITGEIGAGKTTVIKTIMKQFVEQAKIVHIVNPNPDSHQLLRMIAEKFDQSCPPDLPTADVLKLIYGYLQEQYAARYRVVLIIDEAQRLLAPSMEEIRLLSNLETEKDKMIQIIFAGQPELKKLLDSAQLKQLKQRISLWFHIPPLDFEATAQYIQHRLGVAGCSCNPFSQSAVKYIYRVSGGIPRIINTVCDAALLAGYVEQKQEIKACLVEKALDELNLGYYSIYRKYWQITVNTGKKYWKKFHR